MDFEEWFESTVYTDKDCARDAWETALASIEEDVEHRVNAAWQIGYDAGRGVE